jgi:protein SCO1/2
MVVAALLAPAALARAHDTGHDARLPVIGPAPAFHLISQDGAAVALEDFRGRVVAVTFIYTSCPDRCPLLTQKMALVQDALGEDFGSKIGFVSITVDPAHDTPAALKQYAEAYGADLAGWSFLTGDGAVIANLVRQYGGFAAQSAEGEIEHTFLTSLVDAHGMLRVQYLGVRFDPDEFRTDLLSLVEPP